MVTDVHETVGHLFFPLYFFLVVVFLNYNEQEYLLKSEKKSSKYYFCQSTTYRKLMWQMAGRLPGAAPWTFLWSQVGWVLYLDWRHLTVFMWTDPCLFRAWGGSHYPQPCNSFDANNKCSPDLVIFSHWIFRRDALVTSLRFRKAHHHQGATREHPGNPRPVSLRSEDPFRCEGTDSYSTTLTATSCSSHRQSAWFYFRSTCWPIASCSWDDVWAPWTSDPGLLCLSQDTTAKAWVMHCPGKPDHKVPMV